MNVSEMTPELVATGVIILVLGVGRLGLQRLFSRFSWSSIEERRRWIVLVRNGSLVLGSFLIMLVWADELRVIGLSLVAVAVAIAISVQDLIKSLVGSFVRSTSASYSIGDRVQVGEIRGQVIDYSLLTTKLIEVSPGHFRTGRTISVPNSHFLTEPVVNETAGHEFVLHSFRVAVAADRWREARQVLGDAAIAASAEYVAPARKQMEARARRHALATPIVEPMVTARPTSVSEIELSVRVPVAASEVWKVENQILEAWLERLDPV